MPTSILDWFFHAPMEFWGWVVGSIGTIIAAGVMLVYRAAGRILKAISGTNKAIQEVEKRQADQISELRAHVDKTLDAQSHELREQAMRQTAQISDLRAHVDKALDEQGHELREQSFRQETAVRELTTSVNHSIEMVRADMASQKTKISELAQAVWLEFSKVWGDMVKWEFMSKIY